ncbi:MAG: hypothetical protein WBH71_09510 [Bacteroidales bacterium]|jgi:hypothetical protein|nr:hypothetical protein [Bacteroidales bacterium]MDI9592457.1 hypothetical protein [Bacteroidota bacterium]NLH34055.1 hypothetical protein [Lentimicrobium sp.]OQC38239.1 MAG: hypothetical protein BWX63_00338 [Bacteroidetes bacterium ADurb.Bin041]MBP7873539.1 hypothetical protein [Bacteroidales bacterium]
MKYLKKIFRSPESRIPKSVKNGFLKHFPNATNIVWCKYPNLYEAMFYDEEIEKITRFDKSGKLLECRVNSSFSEIPSFVKANIDPGYEIMSSIVVYASDMMNYEFIVRDSELIRYSLIMDSLGNEIKLERL